MASKKFEMEYKKITFNAMADYIENNQPNDKEWFKELVESCGKKYNHLKVKKAFCEKYNPELIPVAKPKAPKKTDRIANW